MSVSASHQIYTIQDVPGKGKGLVAITKISKGTRILSEEPMITIPGNKLSDQQLQISIYQQVTSLSEHQRRALLSMHNSYPYKDDAERYLGIAKTNTLPAEADGDKGAIFLEACRINHACDNNAQKNWNEKIKRHTVHALGDIEKGEEITITYFGPLRNRAARQKSLQERFGFTYLCHLCSLPPEQSQESDRTLEELHRLDSVEKELGAGGILVPPLRILGYFDQQVRLYTKQGREDVGIAQAFIYAAHLAIANSDLARGRIFAEKAASVCQMTLGGDSVEAIKYGALAQDPSQYKNRGVSQKWKTKVDEAPQGLEGSDFEDWLWRRKDRRKGPGKPTDFRNRAMFPSFNGLPDDNVNHEFDTSIDGFFYRPRRQWVFLAEIVHFVRIFGLQMELKDVDDMEMLLTALQNGRGLPLPSLKVQKGHTAAIFHAERHKFLDLSIGIRLEEPRNIKIFPVSLDNLLRLSDRVVKFSSEMDGMRICHGCAKLGATLKLCTRCLLFWYCNGACQNVGWNEKGHKADCKLLKDDALRGLFCFHWDHL